MSNVPTDFGKQIQRMGFSSYCKLGLLRVSSRKSEGFVVSMFFSKALMEFHQLVPGGSEHNPPVQPCCH